MGFSQIDTSELDNILVGRVDPHIYAFRTGTIPDYLKVGDTYRPVGKRLDEWRRHYKDLKFENSWKAKTDDGRIFRDYSVHSFLKDEKGRIQLVRGLFPLAYYSNEFFAGATIQDVNDAIDDIKQDAENNGGKYQLYSPDRLPETYTYERNQDYPLRPNQEQTVANFQNAINNGRTNLLMYAVMRFGKSFTAMCCSQVMPECKITLIVSAKADVRSEWKKTIESHVRFADYAFLDKDSLSEDEHVITKTLAEGKKIAIFLTLQDLLGEEIKDKHREVFESKIDLLIVDETHYGARAAQLGRILAATGIASKNEIKSELKDVDDDEDADKTDEIVKALNARVKLHLSGTPYRILMGDEFTKDDIIAFCQFTDIVELQQQWDEIRLKLDERDEEGEEMHEWDNPYYGFPQMIRFAFRPSANAIRKMEELKENGVTYAFSALFKPCSIIKATNGGHRKFVHEDEILELLKIIDGKSEDTNILSFLNYKKIKEGKMCHHMVFVLPYRASCDAMESLIVNHRSEFLNLRDYEILNISGVDTSSFALSNDDVKRKIAQFEKKGKKTITLTVNRMLTGSTVEQWDTMLYFKDTASPQEYDQAIFRLQNQYVKTYVDETGQTIKFNMKPQTLLVDFDPNRMFRMQELKSQFYNANVDKRGNAKLEERLKKELEVSPIIVLNHNKLAQVTPTNIMDEVRRYSQNRSIADESNDIPCDFGLLDIEAFRSEIEKLNAIDNSKGIEIKPISDDEVDEIDIPEPDIKNEPEKQDGSKNTNEKSDGDDEDNIEKKLATYWTKILFFAFLSDNKVRSLEDVILQISSNSDDHRIAKNLGLRLAILRLIQDKANIFILSKLDYKIQSINDLMRNESLEPTERARIAMKKFARLSNSEVVTPSVLADELVNLIPQDAVTPSSKFLDIATVQGEITCAIYDKFGDSVKDSIYSIPTSSLTYELTRKVYRLLGLDENHVYQFTAHDLIGERTVEITNQLRTLNPKIIIGVPPFNEQAGGGRGDGGNAIYHHFFNYAKSQLSPRCIAMMTQSTWYSGGRGEGLSEFREYMLGIGTEERHIREFHDYPNIEAYVKGVTTLRGGECLFLWDRDYQGDCMFVNKIDHRHEYAMMRPLRYSHDNFAADFLIRWNRGLSILEKVLSRESRFLPDNDMMTRRNPFGFPNESSDKWLEGKKKNRQRCVKVHLAKGKVGYAKLSEFSKEKEGLLKDWKVLVAKSSSGGDTLPHLVISDPIVAGPNTATANTHYAIKGVNSEQEATNLANYLKTRFCRFMINLLRSNQNMRIDMYQFAPRLDFSRSWTDSELYERYDLDDDDQEFIKLIIKERA